MGYAIAAKCVEEEESNKLPYFGSFSSVYSSAALLDLKIAQRQTLKNRVLSRQKIAFLQYGLKDRQWREDKELSPSGNDVKHLLPNKGDHLILFPSLLDHTRMRQE